MLVFRARPRRDPARLPTLTNSERRMMRILGDAMREVRAQVTADEGKLLDAVMHSSADRIVNLVTVEPWLAAQPFIENELLAELSSAGKRVKLPPMRKATVNFGFDAERPEAARWASKEAGGLIVQITEDQRTVVKDYVSRSLLGEFTPQQVARGLRDTIGLTTQQAGWVENFRQRQISERLARDIPFDQAVADSERATNRYHDRIHKYRTETIARTEILRASNEGRKEAWEQGVQEGFIDPAWVKRWSTEFDDRTCDECEPLNGETAPVLGDFPWGDPPLHPNCRCTLLLEEPEEPTEFADLTDDELEALIFDLMDEQQKPLDSFLGEEGVERVGETYEELPNQAEWEASLSDEERQALSDYTSKGGQFSADALNDGLRIGDLTEAQIARVEAIERATSRAVASGIRSDTPLYRGQRLELTGPTVGMKLDEVRERVYQAASERYPIGSEVNLGRGSFVSTSTDTTPALDASATRTSPGIIFEISPTAGAPLQGVTRFDDEYEILLARDQQFRVVGVHRNQTIIDSALEERIRTVVQLVPID